MKLLQNLKKDKKGFTLVEMIVVIVIIGILLAILIPGMFRYIDKAKDKQIMINARTAYLNISTAVAELYGKNGVTGSMVKNALPSSAELKNGSATMTLDAKNGADVVATVKIQDFPNVNSTVTEVTLDITDAGEGSFEITAMKYTEGQKFVYMVNKNWMDVNVPKY